MSENTSTRARFDLDRLRGSLDGAVGEHLRRVGRVVFGDRWGFALFLGALFVFTLWWRVDVLITDTNTIADTLVNVASGHLHLERTPHGSGFDPGAVEVDGVLYGRNYGQVFFALPFYWLLQAASATVGLGAFLIGFSASCLAGFGHQLDRVLDGSRSARIVGVAAAVFLVLNLWIGRGRHLAGDRVAVAALQLSTMVAAAMVGVFVYRLLLRMHGRRVGLFAGCAVVVATPVGFWATIPKRHALVTAIVFVAIYAFYRSRSDAHETALGQTGFRAIAWACAGLLSWVHMEALPLVLALAVVDLTTAPSNGPKTLALVFGAFALSLVPTLLTNFSMSGNPFLLPQMLPPATPDAGAAAVDAGGTAAAGTAPSGTAPSGTPPVDAGGTTAAGGSADASRPAAEDATGGGVLAGVAGSVEDVFDTIVDRYLHGIHTVRSDPEKLLYVFGWSFDFGFGEDEWLFMGGGTNLSVLESAPIAGGLLGFVGLLALRLRQAVASGLAGTFDGIRAVDLFVVLFAVLHTLPYLARLPLKVQVTNRYLLPLYPILVYLVVRHPATRRVVRTRVVHVGYAVQATLCLGAPLLFAGLLAFEYTTGGIFQVHAKIGLAIAGLLGVATLASTIDERADGATGAAVGVAVGSTVLFFTAVAFLYWSYGPAALPLVDRVTGELRYVILVF